MTDADRFYVERARAKQRRKLADFMARIPHEIITGGLIAAGRAIEQGEPTTYPTQAELDALWATEEKASA